MVYASQTIGMSDREIQLILMVGIAIAIPSGVLWGVVADRYGAHFVLSFSLLAWGGLMVIAVAIPWLDWSRHLWWLVGSMVGVAMAGVWTADRPYMLSFVPEEYIGEFFGLHATVGKLGRVIGPVMWAIISGTLGFGQPGSVGEPGGLPGRCLCYTGPTGTPKSAGPGSRGSIPRRTGDNRWPLKSSFKDASTRTTGRWCAPSTVSALNRWPGIRVQSPTPQDSWYGTTPECWTAGFRRASGASPSSGKRAGPRSSAALPPTPTTRALASTPSRCTRS